MSLQLTTAQDIAHALATQHAVMLAGDASSYAQAVHDSDAPLSAETAGVLQGCRMLGFLEHDAQCVAQAWGAQTLRTGKFSLNDWPCTPQDFRLAPTPRANAFPACPQHLGLYAVLPDAQWVGRMARAGVPTVQLRFKSDDAAAIRQEVRAAVQAVQGTNALLFINDHWREAIKAGAYGVHLGQEDLDTLSAAELAEIRDAGLRQRVIDECLVPYLRDERDAWTLDKIGRAHV